MKQEIRTYSSIFEVRETKDNKREIEGYALEWETLSEELGWWFTYREQFKKGAFREYLKDKDTDTKMLLNHDMSTVIGRTKYNTIEIKEDDIGLWFRTELPDTTAGNDIYKSIKRRDIDGVSVGFIVQKQEWDEEDKENVIRTVTKAQLPEFSLTAWPAYSSSNVDARNYDPYKIHLDEKKNKQEFYKRQKILKKILRSISIGGL